MDVLVIGGTVFLGRAMVDEASARGDRVTVFNRGRSGSVPDGVHHLTGDRAVPADLDVVRGRAFDLVIDTCGYVPAVVRGSANLLSERSAHYVFVSSINAFPGWPAAADYHAAGAYGDGDPDAGPDETGGHPDSELYGWRKVGCELAVRRAFGDERCTVLRAGCIVGPNDSAVGRLPWWIDRIARGGEVLTPGTPDAPISLIDARDLARFALLARPGVFETGGPRGRDTRQDLFEAAVTATGAAASPVYVEDRWLAGQDVEPWTQVPLWVAPDEAPSLFTHDSDAAIKAGLTYRPLLDTVRDTWNWQGHVPGGWHASAGTPGLDPARERELLEAWRKDQDPVPAR